MSEREYTAPVKVMESPIGEVYCNIEVIEVLGVYKRRLWVVGKCACGNEKHFKLNALRTNNTKSCGICDLQKRPVDPRRYTENGSKTPTYETWRALKERCNNERAIYFENYGGRGITYDPSWDEFDNFYEDMGPRPEGMTLDRIDVNLPYSKDNCRWLGYTDQRYNSRRRKTNTSGRTGVHFNKKLGKWVAVIQKYGKSRHIGVFLNFEEAVKAREEAEIELYGEVKKYEDV